MDKKRIEKAVREILIGIGEEPNREGLKRTPKRVASMYEEILSGYKEKPQKYLFLQYVTEKYEEIVLIKDIPLYSLCEHHLLPFYGKVHIGYIPKNRRIVGLSKVVRAIEVLSKRLQLQERLTYQIAAAIMDFLKPQGVIVIIEAEHFCMTMRGIKKPGSKVVTSSIKGVFLKDARTRNEVINLINKN